MTMKYGQGMKGHVNVLTKKNSAFTIFTPDGDVDYEQPIVKMEMSKDLATMTQLLRLKLEDGRTVEVRVGYDVLQHASL